MPKNIYTEPMPSPNGTNYERLYIVRKPFAEAMALDAAFDPDAKRGGNAAQRANTAKTAPGTWDEDPDADYDDDGSGDLESKIRQLLEGKLDDADVEMLIRLIRPDPEAEPMPATDRRLPRPGGMARDGGPRITPVMHKRLAEGVVNRANAKQKEIDSLFRRFPALKTARVVG